MKKLVSILLVLTLALTSAITFVACTDKGANTTTEIVYSAGLNQYDITLNVGETFNLVAKKFNVNGKQVTVKNVSYSVEADEVASIDKSGLITAKQTGGTYINVNVDGIEIACFVSVRNSDALNGLVIIFSGKVYKGLPMQAHAYIYEDGVCIATPEQVTFSGSDNAKASVSESGLVTGKEVCDNFVLNASCTYNGKTYNTQKQISIIPPYYYVLSNTALKLASTKTISGSQNQAYTEKSGISVYKVNVLNDKDTQIVKDVAVEIIDETIATIKANDGIITVNSKNIAGTTTARIDVSDVGITVVAKVEVYNAISTIADMDVLAYASLINTDLLAQNYVLVNDIDYNNAVILPIASYRNVSSSTSKRVTGAQWKYWVDKTADGKYVPVSRENISVNNGLTDEEFVAFEAKGINPNNTAFKGVFDGNGYSIKNAKIFYGSILLVEGNLVVPEFAGIFGKLTGTLKNVSFENLTIQDPAQMISQGYKFCETGKELRKSEDGFYQYRGTAIVGTATACEISNVYANINYNHKFISNYSKSVLAVELLNLCKISNCVIESGGNADFGYAIDSSLSSNVGATVKNCLAIGVDRLSKNITEKNQCGMDGNFFLDTDITWKDLAKTTDSDGLTAESVAKATFSSTVWDLSKFNASAGGRPILIKGCSFK